MDNRNRVLDFKPFKDERSRVFGVSRIAETIVSRPIFWRTGKILDQGTEGRCVAFGHAAEAAAYPVPVPGIDDAWANAFWPEVVAQDHLMGNYWEGGASVLAGVKAYKARGLCDSYHWAFEKGDGSEILKALSVGPVLLGINWYDSMYETRPSGLVEVSGPLVGGHCILLTGYHPHKRLKGEGWLKRHEVYEWTNSWSDAYGVRGKGWIKAQDLYRLLGEGGEACVPVGRKGA